MINKKEERIKSFLFNFLLIINVPLNQNGYDNSLIVGIEFGAYGKDYKLQLVALRTLDAVFTGTVLVHGYDTGDHPYTLSIKKGESKSDIEIVPTSIKPMNIIAEYYIYRGNYSPVKFG